jgi:biopolymer transport protein ExbD
MLANRLNPPICKIDMTALTGVLFVLFFSTMIADAHGAYPHDGVGIDLARVDHPSPMPGADREDALIVVIMRDGKVFFDNDLIMRGDLAAKVAQRLTYANERKLYVKEDARARYGTVKAALDGIRAAGVPEVGLLVEQRRGKNVGNF